MGGMNFRDPYEPGPYGMESVGGLLGRLLALQAEQRRYQSAPANSERTQSASQNPNFRQVSRAPFATGPQRAVGLFNRADDQTSPPHSPIGGASPAPLRTPRQGDKAAQSDYSFSDRIQTSWHRPHPYGLVSALKAALNGIEQAVQGSIDATSVPSTEEGSFRQNQGRELGPIGAWKAASLLTPLLPRGTGGILPRPRGAELRNDLSWPAGARIARQGIEGTNTSAPPLRFVSGNRLPSESQGSAAFAKTITELAGIDLQNPALLPPISGLALPDWKEPFVQEMASRKGGRRKEGGREESEWYKNFKKDMAEKAAARKAAAEKAGRLATQAGGDDEDVCTKQKSKEVTRCFERKDEYAHSDFMPACFDRAETRRDLCKRNGGRIPRKPAEWGPADEEVYFETGR